MGWGTLGGIVGGIGGFALGGPQGALAGAGIGAGIGNGVDANNAQEAANNANRLSAAQQMHFQSLMSSTAYTRAVADMKNAGINPMMAVQNGGASTPSGAMSRDEAPPPAMAGLASGASNLADLIMRMKQNESQVKETDSRTALNTVSMANVIEDTKAKGASAAVARANEKLLSHQLQGAKNKEWRDQQVNKVYQVLGPWLDKLKRGYNSAFGKESDQTIEQGMEMLK